MNTKLNLSILYIISAMFLIDSYSLLQENLTFYIIIFFTYYNNFLKPIFLFNISIGIKV